MPVKDRRALWISLLVFALLFASVGGFLGYRSKLKRKNQEFFQGGRDACFSRIVARFPDLEPAWKTVPDERNGFLQLLKSTEKRSPGGIGSASLGLSKTAKDMFCDAIPWNATVATREIGSHRKTMEELTRIGLLPEASAKGIGIDRISDFGVNMVFAKDAYELLMADARLAAENGDARRAVKRVRAAAGLARHLRNVETRTLLTETIVILMLEGIRNSTLKHVVPPLKKNPAAIAKLREALKPPGKPLPEDFGELLRSEWRGALHSMVIPGLFGEKGTVTKLGEMKIEWMPMDIPGFVDASTKGYLEAAKRARHSTLADLLDPSKPLFPPAPDDLGKKEREYYETLQPGVSSWALGCIRLRILGVRTDAAFAILLGQRPPNEPITGLPFLFDPAKRTLALPADPRLRPIIETEPLKVP